MTDAGAGRRVRVVRSGGFAGMRLERELDLDQLDDTDAESWRRLIDSPAVQEPARGERPHPDGFSYRVVSDADGVDVTLPEQQLGAEDRSLLERALRPGPPETS